MALHLYDTLSTKLKPLTMRRPGEVGVYCCGPTTYDVAHIGHARAALAPDILVRHLRAQGLNVTYVRNVTDVDDKILKRATESGTPPMELSARFAGEYQRDMGELGCAPPDHEPKVSENIGEIVAIITTLVDNGAAYVVDMPSGARDVYYAVRAFAGYGKLSKRNVDDLRVGARVEASDDKKDPLDFALWKGCVGDAWGWASPWGKGRPGWHIECSAMSDRYLGHGMEVHCGGMDLVFPHHENEIAQSEAAHPGEGDFARIWMHNGFVNIDKEKMAKSLGNFVTVRQALERNDAEAIRFFLLGVQYRGPIGFDTDKLASGRVVFPGICEAERRVDYIYLGLARANELAARASGDEPQKTPKDLAPFALLAKAARGRVDAALDDDLNTPVALAVLGEVASAAHELAELANKRKKDAELQRAAPFVARAIAAAVASCAAPLGLLVAPQAVYVERTQARRLALYGLTPAGIEGRLADRAAARAAKDFAKGDAIRKELEAAGVEVADGPTGTTWRALA
ncbi:MAG TPA: cysteine--tRNA ligase [Byssovorax sp.]|jgi:cysteinyl-tRNA synthetase